MKTILYSPYPLNSCNANSIRLSHFLNELKKNLDIDVFFPLLPQVRNNRPYWWRFFREFLTGIELIVRLIFSKHKLILLSSPPYITILLSSLFLAFFKRKYILDIRDPYPEVFFEIGLFSSSSNIGKVLKSLTRFIYKRSAGITAATMGVKKIIESYGINKDITCFYNGFDKDLFSPKKTDEKFKQFTLIFHGNLAKMQNIDLLVQLSRKCSNDIDIIVVGSGPQEGKVKKEKRIKFLGILSHKDIAKTVNKSHIGLSFRKDGLMGQISFPVKIFEYIGAGLPVISTPHTEAGEFLKKNHLGFQFANHELEKIVKKIIHLKSNYQINQPYNNLSRQIQAKMFCQYVYSIIKNKAI